MKNPSGTGLVMYCHKYLKGQDKDHVLRILMHLLKSEKFFQFCKLGYIQASSTSYHDQTGLSNIP